LISIKHGIFKVDFRIFFLIIFEKKKDEQIFTSLSLKISHILPKTFCDPEPENLTEVWTRLKKQRLCHCSQNDFGQD